jgi:cysteine synthase A
MAIFTSITELVGNTPIVKLNSVTRNLEAEVYVKLESMNPASSVKDRIGLAMIEDAEKAGLLKPGSTIIEPTSGNTGIALAFIGAAKGYKVILTMPDTMSIERRKLLEAYGADVVLTPGNEGMKGAIATAEKILEELPDAFMPMQFKNEANPQMHRRTTAEEIWRDMEGDVDIFVTGVGTGGTVTGTGSRLKELKPDIQVFAVEPDSSAVLSGAAPGPHKIQGIGAGFIPEVMNSEVLDGILQISSEEAGATARKIAREEGILCGISAGGNVLAALTLAAKPENKGKKILTVICDTGERYLSTWLFSQSS